MTDIEQKQIEILREWKNDLLFYQQADHMGLVDDRTKKPESEEQIIEALQNDWVSVEERLPEETGRYLVEQIDKGDVESYVVSCWYDTDFGWDILLTLESIKAWQPLPKPPNDK